MKTSEFKLRIVKAIDDLVDVYFGEDNIIDNMTNSTLKLMIQINADKMDDVLALFADKDGEIDANTIINAYADNIGENGVSFNIKQYVKNDIIRSLLPDKTLIISKEDILKIINQANSQTSYK